jgi:transposase
MASKSMSMNNVRQITKFYSQNMEKKKIGERLGMPKNTVKLYIKQYLRLRCPGMNSPGLLILS